MIKVYLFEEINYYTRKLIPQIYINYLYGDKLEEIVNLFIETYESFISEKVDNYFKKDNWKDILDKFEGKYLKRNVRLFDPEKYCNLPGIFSCPIDYLKLPHFTKKCYPVLKILNLNNINIPDNLLQNMLEIYDRYFKIVNSIRLMLMKIGLIKKDGFLKDNIKTWGDLKDKFPDVFEMIMRNYSNNGDDVKVISGEDDLNLVKRWIPIMT